MSRLPSENLKKFFLVIALCKFWHIKLDISSYCPLHFFECKIWTPSREQWLSGRVLDSSPSGRGFKPHPRHCVRSLSKTHLSLLSTDSTQDDPSPLKNCWLGHKESNQTNKWTPSIEKEKFMLQAARQILRSFDLYFWIRIHIQMFRLFIGNHCANMNTLSQKMKTVVLRAIRQIFVYRYVTLTFDSKVISIMQDIYLNPKVTLHYYYIPFLDTGEWYFKCV